MWWNNKYYSRLAAAVALALFAVQPSNAFVPLAVVNKAFAKTTSRQFLYLAEDAVPGGIKMKVPRDKTLSADESWLAASLNVDASSTAVIEDDTSLSSAQVQFEAISQNLDAALDEITDYEMEMTVSSVVEPLEEELLVGESRLASEYYNDDSGDDDDDDDDDDYSASGEAVDSFAQDVGHAFDAGAIARPTFVISHKKKSDPNQESHQEQDNELPTNSHFATIDDVLKLKEQPDNFLFENTVSHFAKAAENAGRAAFLTFGAMFKAVTSEEVAESASEASSTMSAAVQSITDAIDNDSKKTSKSAEDHQSIADAVSEGFETVASSVGAVAGAFLRNFESAPESDEAFEAAKESTKQCASLFASMVAFGMKQGERVVALKDGETVVAKEMAKQPEEPTAAEDMSLEDINMRVEMPTYSVNKNGSARGKDMTANEMEQALKNMVGEDSVVEKNPKEQAATKKVSLGDINMQVELATEKVLTAMRRE